MLWVCWGFWKLLLGESLLSTPAALSSFRPSRYTLAFPVLLTGSHWAFLSVLTECHVCVTLGVTAPRVFAKQMAWAPHRDSDAGSCFPRGSLSWSVFSPCHCAERLPGGRVGRIPTHHFLSGWGCASGSLAPTAAAHRAPPVHNPVYALPPLSPPGANSLQTRGPEQGDLQVWFIRQHPS